MDKKLVEQIREDMKSKSTEELLTIWEENDRENWSNEAFEAIKQLLLERGEILPPQKEFKKEETMEEQKRSGLEMFEVRVKKTDSENEILFPEVCACCGKSCQNEHMDLRVSNTDTKFAIPVCKSCVEHVIKAQSYRRFISWLMGIMFLGLMYALIEVGKEGFSRHLVGGLVVCGFFGLIFALINTLVKPKKIPGHVDPDKELVTVELIEDEYKFTFGSNDYGRRFLNLQRGS